MKLYFTLIIMLLVTVQAIAGPVSMEEAQKKAAAFMATKGKGISGVKAARISPRQNVKSNCFDENSENAAYYIFQHHD